MLFEAKTRRYCRVDGTWQYGLGLESCGNAGVGGDTWQTALSRAWAVCAARPEAVVVLLGVNDMWNHEGSGTPEHAARVSGDAIADASFGLDYLRACGVGRVVLSSLLPENVTGSKPALGGEPPWGWLAEAIRMVNEGYRGLADARADVTFCDVHTPVLASAAWNEGRFLWGDGLRAASGFLGGFARRAQLGASTRGEEQALESLCPTRVEE